MHRRHFLQQLGVGATGIAFGARHPEQASVLLNAHAPSATATDRMAWWRDARFGMFIHFGLYSTLGGEWKGKAVGSHEWIRNNAKIPHDEYIPLIGQFIQPPWTPMRGCAQPRTPDRSTWC